MDDKIISDYFEKRIGFTDNPHEAMFILRDGQLVSGGFFGGIRGEDHRIAEGLIDLDRYDKDFWSKLHYETGIVQLVPETATALIMEGQKINSLQESVIESIGYKIEVCCPTYNLNLENKRVAKNEEQVVRTEVSNPKAMDLDDYLGTKGLSSPMSDFMIDKSRGNRQLKTTRGQEKFEKEANAAREEYSIQRKTAIEEYNDLVKKGQIRPKSSVERELDSAHGNPEKESTQAARRILEKRGIDWKTGEALGKAISTQNLSGGIAGAKERAIAKLKEKQASHKELARETHKNEIER